MGEGASKNRTSFMDALKDDLLVCLVKAAALFYVLIVHGWPKPKLCNVVVIY